MQNERHERANLRVHRYLIGLGFHEVIPPKQSGPRRALVAYEGYLPGTANPWCVRLEIDDWDFLQYPRITLLSVPHQFMPHVDEAQGLCYLAPGSVILPRHDPIRSMEHCLQAAADELNRQSQPNYVARESVYEFQRYWASPWETLLGTIAPATSITTAYSWELRGKMHLICADRAEALQYYRHFVDTQCAVLPPHTPVWLIPLQQAPWLPPAGAPSDLGALWAWLKQIDPSAPGRMFHVATLAYLARAKTVSVLFHYQSTRFGFRFIMPPLSAYAFRSKGANRFAKHLRDGQGRKQLIERWTPYEIGPDYIHRRNLAQNATLEGKSIHLVGAGAIGGYLAEALVRLGAGTSGGVLRIIDYDFLTPDNIGRHALGMNHLFFRKADALRTELMAQFPYVRIEEVPVDARELKALFQADLVIDATGEEALSLVLNESHQELLRNGQTSAPMVFAWVLGNGEVVQTLLSDGGHHACYDCCDTVHHAVEAPTRRYPILKEEPQERYIGCHTMRPYAVSAPMTAAALTAQLVADWISGRPSPRFRTLFLNRGPHLERRDPDGDPTKSERCPSCART